MLETLFKALGFKKIERIRKSDVVIRKYPDEKEYAPITPVEYDDASCTAFSREEKKIKRLRDYLNSPESDKDNKIKDL